MKIAILYICTGKYTIFWKDFYITCEENFIPEGEKTYFVFTDSDTIDFEKENNRIHRIYQENLGWPNNTLKRYEVFLKIKKQLENFDYIIFFNANLLFIEKINEKEFLPQEKQELIGCLHPGYFNKNPEKFTYERNTKSTAFLKKGKYYFAGGINGGRANVFLQTITKIKSSVDEDEKNKIVAIWHDESHWNKHLNINLEHTKILSPSFLYPEHLKLPFRPKIIIRDKKMLGGHAKFRNKLEARIIISNLKDQIKKIIKI